jgi:hypothetical protein
MPDRVYAHNWFNSRTFDQDVASWNARLHTRWKYYQVPLSCFKKVFGNEFKLANGAYAIWPIELVER